MVIETRIDEEAVERAVWFLRDSGKVLGSAKGHMVYCEGNLRRVKSLQMITMEGSVADRETRAYASDAYAVALNEYRNVTAEYETIRAQREGAQYLIDVWRSQNSSRKAGI